MSCRDQTEKFINESIKLIELKRFDILHAFLVNYGPQLVDIGIDLDRLYTENDRLTAIVNLIELKTERDDLKQRVVELEAKLGVALVIESIGIVPEERDAIR